MTMTYDEILRLFPDKPREKAYDGWKVICPAHNDKNPSLLITPADNPDFVADFKCFAGCSPESILNAIKLTGSDNRQNWHKTPLIGDPVKVYDYLDNSGKLLHQTLRYEPKTFRQRRPDGKGGYIWNLDSITPVIYHLPEIIKAISSGDTIWIPEGEKDVDSLWDIGLVATCNPMGANKWRESYTDLLLGAARVIIIPDNDLLKEKPDTVGLEHATNIATSLVSKGLKVKLLQPFNDAKDVSDWFALGHTANELLGIADATLEFTPGPEILTTTSGERVTLRCISEIQPQKVNWLWYPRLPIGKLTMLSGDPGEGKSQLYTAIGAGVTRGRLPDSDPFEPGVVLVACAEDGLADTIRPRFDAYGADNSKVFVLDGLFTLDDAGCELLDTAISRKHPVLTTIDPLSAYLGEKLDVNKANQVRHVTARLAVIAEKYQCAILMVRHLTKSKGTKAVYQGQGNVDLTAAVRSELLAGHDPDDDNNKALVHIKSNLAKKAKAIGYRLESAGADGRDCRFSWTGASELTYGQMFANEDGGTAKTIAKEFLIEILKNGRVLSEQVSKLATERGISPATLNRAKKDLGIISKPEYGTGKKGTQSWYFVMPDEGKTKD